MLSGHFFSTLPIQETYSTGGRASSTLFGWGIAETEVDQFRHLVTLEDAGTYITKLPKAEHTTAEWQAAMEALILVATLGGPTMFARIAVMRALNRHVEPVFDASRKQGLRPANKETAAERGLSQNQVSVRREAVHIRASRFGLIKMAQTFLRYRNRIWEASHEAFDDSCFCGCRFMRRRDRHAAVSFDRAARPNGGYALVAGAPHRSRRKQAPERRL